MKKTFTSPKLVFLWGLTVFLLCCGQSKKQSLLFLEKARGLGGIIITQAEADTNLCNMYTTVWEYARVTNLDFRSAYREMSLDMSGTTAQMETNMAMMERMMKMVENPPQNMTGIKDKLIELRQSYLEFNKYVMQLPQGTQERFNAEVDAHIVNINALKEELDGLIAQAEANL